MFYIISNESLSSIIVIFPVGNDAINSEPLKYSVFYSKNTPIKLSLV